MSGLGPSLQTGDAHELWEVVNARPELPPALTTQWRHGRARSVGEARVVRRPDAQVDDAAPLSTIVNRLNHHRDGGGAVIGEDFQP